MSEKKIKKGVFIGIDYVGTYNELQNCGNDAKDMLRVLDERYGVEESVLILDEAEDPQKTPTRENITHWLKWLVEDNQAGDVLWLHYSGHGAYVKDKSGDESDGYDETLVPLDFESNGEITDDELNKLVCQPVVSSGATLYFHDDCCHSGSGMDLRYSLKVSDGKPQETEYYYAEEEEDFVEYDHSELAVEPFDYSYFYNPYQYQYNDPYLYQFNGMLYTMQNFWDTFVSPYFRHTGGRGLPPVPDYRVRMPPKDPKKKRVLKTRPRKVRSNTVCWEVSEDLNAPELEGEGKVVKWSGCQDDQTSADGFAGKENGAMTGSVMTVLEEGVETWGEFLRKVRELLKTHNFTQIPQLCFSGDLQPGDKCLEL